MISGAKIGPAARNGYGIERVCQIGGLAVGAHVVR